jgi:hypothetical protein
LLFLCGRELEVRGCELRRVVPSRSEVDGPQQRTADSGSAGAQAGKLQAQESRREYLIGWC